MKVVFLRSGLFGYFSRPQSCLPNAIFILLLANACISDPPGAPNITGLTSESILIESQVRRMTCISVAGNPLADLTWFRGDDELSQAVTVKGRVTRCGDFSPIFGHFWEKWRYFLAIFNTLLTYFGHF